MQPVPPTLPVGPPASAKRRRTWLWVLLAFAVAVGALAIGALGLLRLAQKGIASRDVTPEERRLLVSIDHLAEFTEIPGRRSLCERWVAKTNLDGSLELGYAYDTDFDPAAESFLYLSSEASPYDTVKGAQQGFSDQVAAYKFGMGLVKERSMKERPDLFTLGEENYCALVSEEGEVIGNIVVARQGKNVYSLILYGMYFDDQSLLEEFLGPALRGKASIGGAE